MLFVFNTLTVGERTYTEADIKRVIMAQDFGIDTDFYGGRIYAVAETDTDVCLLLENKDGLKVIDTCAKSLTNIPMKVIREMAKRRKLKFDAKTSKEELIAILGG